MEPLRLTKDELIGLYPDEEWRRSFFEISRLVDFFSSSILNEKYKLPDDLTNCVHLTEHGNRIMQKLITKNEVPPKEARMLCLLRLAHREPLIDPINTKAEDLRNIIDAQIRSNDLLYPLVFGRELYDKAANLFDDARDLLTYRDTLRLLDGMPTGIFQSGHFVSGPYGLLRSSELRWFAPRTSVPLYHCSDMTCGVIHLTRLSSDMTAAVNEHGPTLERVLDQMGEDHSEWFEFIDSVQDVEGLRYDDRSLEPITLALGDLFGDAELRILLADLLDNSSGELRAQVEPLGLRGRADEIVEGLSRPQVTQLLLLTSNERLSTRIDKLVVRGNRGSETAVRIDVPRGEVRRLRTNRGLAYGTFAIFPELSIHGLRFVSEEVALAPLRLKRLVESLYRLDDHAEVDELQWQLRDVEGEDPHEQLEEYVRSASPHEVICRLVLSRRTNQILVCERLGLEFDDYQNDDLFVESVLWKLGFYNDDFDDRNKAFWDHHGRLKRYAQTAAVGARVDAVELRSRAVNYFVELEGVLDDSLAFTTWALTQDHLASDTPFAFSLQRDRMQSFSRLNAHEDARESGDEVIRLDDANTLYPLIRGFGILADLLSHDLGMKDKYQRDHTEYPRYSAYTDLKTFPFRHGRPFLDLLPRSQERILETLQFVRGTLEQASVHQVRNDYLHYRASATDLPRLDASLDAVERAVARLEADGMCRLVFGLVSDSGDGWDRRVYTLRNARNREIAFARPSAFDWTRMPSLRGLQYVMPAAVFARPNEMLRFKPVFPTEYSDYWEAYPKRRTRRGSIGAKVTPPQEVMS